MGGVNKEYSKVFLDKLVKKLELKIESPNGRQVENLVAGVELKGEFKNFNTDVVEKSVDKLAKSFNYYRDIMGVTAVNTVTNTSPKRGDKATKNEVPQVLSNIEDKYTILETITFDKAGIDLILASYKDTVTVFCGMKVFCLDGSNDFEPFRKLISF